VISAWQMLRFATTRKRRRRAVDVSGVGAGRHRSIDCFYSLSNAGGGGGRLRKRRVSFLNREAGFQRVARVEQLPVQSCGS
jgi:hypothetical protein